MFNKKKSSLSVFNFKTGLKKTRITNLPGLLAIVFIIAIGIGGCKKDDQQMAPPAEKKWLVTTVAGNGSAAFSDGPSLSAEFRTPSDIAIAADGTMYVADAASLVTANHGRAAKERTLAVSLCIVTMSGEPIVPEAIPF